MVKRQEHSGWWSDQLIPLMSQIAVTDTEITTQGQTRILPGREEEQIIHRSNRPRTPGA